MAIARALLADPKILLLDEGGWRILSVGAAELFCIILLILLVCIATVSNTNTSTTTTTSTIRTVTTTVYTTTTATTHLLIITSMLCHTATSALDSESEMVSAFFLL